MTKSITRVSFDDLHHELIDIGGTKAASTYNDWRKRRSWRGYEKVVPFVEGFTHEFLYTITEEQLQDVKKRSHHALGNLDKKEVLKVGFEDVHIPFANQFLFHMYMEESKSLPTWQAWWNWLKSDGKEFYIDVVKERKGFESLGQIDQDSIKDAVQWRLGKAYYSAFREVELLTKLRSTYGLPVKYHMLADVLLKVDFWMNKTIISVFRENEKFREKTKGRKQRAEDIFDTTFSFPEVTVSAQGFGNFWLLNDADIVILAEKLRNAR